MTLPIGIILAGGLSRRMEGPEKSLLKLGSQTLIEGTISKLERQGLDIVINANGDTSRFAALSKPVQPDTVEGFAGPLAGVLAGMRWTQENTKATHIITAAADTPFFPDTYTQDMLTSAKSSKAQIALASSNGRHHPVFGLWPVELANALEDFLVVEENRKVMLFVQRYENCKVEFANLANGIDPFFNVNTPDDMKQARKIALELEGA